MYAILLVDPINLISAYVTQDGIGASPIGTEWSSRGIFPEKEAEFYAKHAAEWGWRVTLVLA